VNGKTQTVDVDPATPLLYVLGYELGLRGPKFGCGMAQCGACTLALERPQLPWCRLQLAMQFSMPRGFGCEKFHFWRNR